MQIEKIHEELSKIAKEIKALVRASMEGENGINKKTGTNTLINSNIYNDLEANVEDLELIKFLIHDYYVYIENGRSSGSWPPPQVIAEWCQRKGIPSDNSTVYLICKSIYEKGIKPRPFLDEGWEFIDEFWDTWSDEIFEILMQDVNAWFND